MEWLTIALGTFGILAMIALPFLALFWIVRQFYRGFRAKITGLTELVPDGVITTGKIIDVRRDRSGEHLRTHSSFEYFDQQGNRYTGEVGGAGYAVGDAIRISYLPHDPQVHDLAEVVDGLRAKHPTST